MRVVVCHSRANYDVPWLRALLAGAQLLGAPLSGLGLSRATRMRLSHARVWRRSGSQTR